MFIGHEDGGRAQVEPPGAARIDDLLPGNWKAAADATQREAAARLAIANVVKSLVYR